MSLFAPDPTVNTKKKGKQKPNPRRQTRKKRNLPYKPYATLAVVLASLVVLVSLAVGLNSPGSEDSDPVTVRKNRDISALAIAGSFAIQNSENDGGPTPKGAIPYQRGTASESTTGARMLFEQYVKSGKVTFVDSACSGTRQDFLDQLARPNTYRGAGRGTYINPSVWRYIQVIAQGQEKRGNPLPYVEISCLARAHSINTKGGSVSNHPGGNAVDIGVIGGYRIGSPAQYRYDPVYQSIRDLWEAKLYSCQAISHHGKGGISDLVNPSAYNSGPCDRFTLRGAFYMSNHGDHLHLDAFHD